MKTRIFLLLFLILFTVKGFPQAEDIRITGNFAGRSFASFAEETGREHNLKFFYKPEWVEDINMDRNYDNEALSAILSEVLAGSGLYFLIDESGYVILSKSYAIKNRLHAGTADTAYIEPMDYSIYFDDDESNGFQVIRIGSPSGDKRGSVSISGYVRNRNTGEPVIGAVFMIEELQRGAMTNEYGYYSLTMPRGGDYHVNFSCLGMKSLNRQLQIYESGSMDVEMKENLIPLGSITVTAEGSASLSRMEVGLEKLSIKDVKLLPTNMGVPDIIKTALLLPGIQTVGEGTQGFNVRGGSADQNLILLYDVPVFNTSHFLGFFSSVNSDVINDISLYKGGIPAKYGGRISSVMHIVPRDGNKKKISGSGGISPVTSNLMIEGPIIKDRTSLILAGRSTYSNWILGLLEDPALRNSKVSFYDANIRLVHEINKNNSLELSSYISHDAFKFNNDTLYSYDNSLVSLKWRHVFSEKLFAVFSANKSKYNYNISSTKDIYNSFELLHDIDYSELKSHLTWYPGYRHQADMGLDIAIYGIIPGELVPVGDSSVVLSTMVERQRAVVPALFFSERFKITDRLTLNAGVRLSSFFALGPATVYDYLPGFSKSKATITDTTHFGKGEIIEKYFNPELRLSVNYLIGAASSVKINYNSTAQYLHQLSNTASVSPTDIWVLSDSHLKPQRGRQLALGLYTKLFSNNLQVSIEGYYKKIDDMIDFKGGARLLMNDNIETDIINTIGRAGGVEMMIKKDKGRLNGWISYTYSKTEIRSNTPFIQDRINKGEWFPANYDKPHDLSVILNYIFSRRFSLSGTYVYSTGRPITYPIASFTYGGADVLHYSDRNRYRIPDYSRLDVSFTINGSLKSKKLAHSTLTFSVYNLLGRDNVYSIYFKTDNTLVQGYKLSVFARPIPSVTYNFKF
ncbi:MAG: TonB-dependent receptor [Bacteroidales bacterium]|nr:TonB-dependent receptor [Bacteroidales bacterium]